MALNTIDAKIKIKRTNVPGATPSIGPSNDHTDGTWSDNDIYVGEYFLNTVDDRLWIGTDNGIKEIDLIGGSYGTDYLPLDGGTMSGFIGLNSQVPIRSSNGGGQLDLDAYGTSGSVMLSNDNGGYGNEVLFFSSDGIELSSYDGNESASLYLKHSGVDFGDIGVVLLAADAPIIIPPVSESTIRLISIGSEYTNTITIESNSTTFDKSIILDSQIPIGSSNGTSALLLDAYGNSGNILLSTDGASYSESGLDISNSNGIYLFSKNGGDYVVFLDEEIRIHDTVQNLGIAINPSINQSRDTISIQESTTNSNTSASASSAHIFINSRDGYLGSGADNSVMLGGNGLTGSNANTVYVPNLNINGSEQKFIRNVSANYSLDADKESIVLVDSTSSAISIKFHQANNTGQIITIKDIGGSASVNNITIGQNTSVKSNIDGSTSYTINTNYESITMVADGTDWWII